MPLFLKGKKFILCAVAVIVAAISAIAAISFTYAGYREDLLADSNAQVAGAIAEYVPGEVLRNYEVVSASRTDSGLNISELAPGDLVTYNFGVNGFSEDDREIHYNEVLLRVTCEFTFLYSRPVASGGENIYLSVSQNQVTFSHGTGDSASQIYFKQGNEDIYFDPSVQGDDWRLEERESGSDPVMYTVRFGFFIPPVSAQTDAGARQNLSFTVQIPQQEGTSENPDEILSEMFNLSIDIKIKAEQYSGSDTN